MQGVWPPQGSARGRGMSGAGVPGQDLLVPSRLPHGGDGRLVTETFFTADLHFGHRFMRELRQSQTGIPADFHDQWLIERWNSVVGPRDEVWMLGDFSFMPPARTEPYFSALRGRKHLVIGNHDPRQIVQRLGWESVHELVSRRFDGQRIVMCHYPLLTWANAHYGTWMLHGHSHGGLTGPVTTRLDVGIDCHPEYRPFSLDEVQTVMLGRDYVPVDHHG